MTHEWLTPQAQALLLDGLQMTLALTAVTSLLALVVGVGICRLRLSRARWFAILYIETCRNVPALVWVIFFTYALPNIFDLETRRALFFQNGVMDWLKETTGVLIPYYMVGAVLGLTVNTSAYLAELLRAGIQTLHQEQIDSARSLGASPRFLFFYALLSHGIRAASPGITTRLVHNLKNTALASFVAVPEFFKAVQTSISRSFYAVEFLLLASVVYWLLSWGFALLLRHSLPRPVESA